MAVLKKGEGQKFCDEKILTSSFRAYLQSDTQIELQIFDKIIFCIGWFIFVHRTILEYNIIIAAYPLDKLSFLKEVNSREDSFVASPRYACKLQVIYIQSYTRFKAALTCKKHHVRNF